MNPIEKAVAQADQIIAFDRELERLQANPAITVPPTAICTLHEHKADDLHDPLLCNNGGDCDECAPQDVGIVLNACGVGISPEVQTLVFAIDVSNLSADHIQGVIAAVSAQLDDGTEDYDAPKDYTHSTFTHDESTNIAGAIEVGLGL